MQVTNTLIAVVFAAVATASPLIQTTAGNSDISAVPHTGHKTVHQKETYRSSANLRNTGDNYDPTYSRSNVAAKEHESSRAYLKVNTQTNHPNVTHSLHNAKEATKQAVVDVADEAEEVYEDTKGTVKGIYYIARENLFSPIGRSVKWVGRQASNAALWNAHNTGMVVTDVAAVGAGGVNAVARGVNYVTSKAVGATEAVQESVDQAHERQWALAKLDESHMVQENAIVGQQIGHVANKTAEALYDTKEAIAERARRATEAAQAKARELKLEAQRKAEAVEAERVRLSNEQQTVRVKTEPAQYITERTIEAVTEDASVIRERQRLQANAVAEKALAEQQSQMAKADEAARKQAQRLANSLENARDEHNSKANARWSASAQADQELETGVEVKTIKTETVLAVNGSNFVKSANGTVTYENGTQTITHPNGTVSTYYANGTLAAPAAGASGISATVALGFVFVSAVLLL